MRYCALIAAIFALIAACSADTGAGGSGGTQAKGGASGSSGSIEVGGTSAGGNAGTIGIDAGAAAGSAGIQGDACASTSVTADDPVPLPADIIWFVDQSGSMDQETQYVQTQINNFANLIGQTSIDYHVVMIAATTGSNAICVPPPLSGGGCGNGPRFRLVDQHIDSNDGLNHVISTYPQYQDFLRPNAVKHFVAVTDDDATDSPINSAQAFTSALANLQPAGMFTKWQFHAIYAYGGVPFVGCFGPFGTGAAIGTVYAALVQQTQGAQGEICIDNWQPVFSAITTAVQIGSKVSCEYVIPDPGGGQTLDPSKVNVDYLPGGNPPPQPIYRVNGPGDCGGPGQGGWYYDDNVNPTKILLCPATCTAVQSDPAAKIDVRFGCESVFKPPA